MKHIRTSSLLLLALSTPAIAQQPVQGPSYKGEDISITGEVATNTGSPYKDKPCIQLKVLPDVRYSGGRVWVCDTRVTQFRIGDKIQVSGHANDTRLTKMGPYRRVIPLIAHPTQINKVK